MDIIFVTGMSRSGTSALARVLSLCGAALPDRLLRPGEGNPRGYWEAAVALKRNDQFMDALGTSYHDPSLRILDADVPETVRKRHTANIVAFLQGLPKAEAVVVKDPRISGLVESWDDACKSLGLTPKYVHIFRHPADVAASLKERYGMPAGYASALWLKYNLLPERMTRRSPRIFVSYRELLADWSRVVRTCNETLGLALAIDDVVGGQVAEFLSRDLEHHRADESAGFKGVLPGLWLERAHTLLKRAAETGRVDEHEADRLFEEYAGVERFFRNAQRNYLERFQAGRPVQAGRGNEPAPAPPGELQSLASVSRVP